jgi:hypothetical protein
VVAVALPLLNVEGALPGVLALGAGILDGTLAAAVALCAPLGADGAVPLPVGAPELDALGSVALASGAVLPALVGCTLALPE